jgi:plasmid stabilization system protein ParE
MAEVVWKQGAENDLLEVFSNLEEWREGAGDQFVLSLDTLLQTSADIRKTPVFHRPMRRMMIGSWGYSIFYAVEARGIIIHALIHLSQNPEAIRERIRRHLGLD